MDTSPKLLNPETTSCGCLRMTLLTEEKFQGYRRETDGLVL